MGYQKYDSKELSFGTLLLRTLFRWRLILLVAIIGAALGFAGQLVKNGRNTDVTSSAQKKYEKQMEEYEKESSYYKDQEKNLKQQIADKQNYLRDSIRSHINPKKEGYASVNLIIRTDSNSDSDTLQAVQAYASFFKGGVDWDALSKDMDKNAEYLQELLTVTPNSENKQQNFSSSHTVYVRAIGRTKKEAEKVLKYVLEQLPDAQKEVSAVIPHTVSQVFQSSGYRVDNNLNDNLYTEYDLLKNLKDDLETLTSDGAAVTKPEMPASISTRDLLKQAGKYTVAGFVGGAVVIYILIALYLVFHHRVLSADELNRTYQLKNLVTVQTTEKKGLDRKLRSKITVDTDSESEAWKIAALNLASAVDAGESLKQIVVCGDLPAEKLQKIAAQLEEAFGKEMSGAGCCHFVTFRRIYGIPEALEKLKDADGVVLAEQVEYSDYREISRDVIAIESCGKKVFGSLTLEV